MALLPSFIRVQGTNCVTTRDGRGNYYSTDAPPLSPLQHDGAAAITPTGRDTLDALNILERYHVGARRN